MAICLGLWNRAEWLEATQLQAFSAFTEQLLSGPQTATQFWLRLAVIKAMAELQSVPTAAHGERLKSAT